MDQNAAFNMTKLVKLAQSDNPGKRDQLMIAVGSLCAIQPADNSGTTEVFGEVLMMLNKTASEEARQQTSNLLCSKPWSPRPLVLSWASDIIPVANPVLLKSPVLQENDLVDIAENASLFHRLAIADRPQIGELVTDCLTKHAESEVLVALTQNPTAKLNMESFASCVRVSRRCENLRGSLSERNDLPKSLLPSLFAYSTSSERTHIAEKFGVNVENFSEMVLKAVQKTPDESSSDPEAAKELEVARLIAKLAKSDKLGPGMIVKAVAEEKILIFEHAISHLANVPVEQFRSSIQRDSIKAMALACRAAQIDKSVFPTLYKNLYETGYLKQELTPQNSTAAAKAFGGHSPAAASVALRLLSPNS